MGISDDCEDDWIAEAHTAMSRPAEAEFKRLMVSLRRQAGYDLTWWERLILRAAKGLRIDFKWR